LACVILSEVVPSGNPKTQKGKSWLDWLRRKSQHGNLNWEIDDKAWRDSIVSDKPSYLMLSRMKIHMIHDFPWLPSGNQSHGLLENPCLQSFSQRPHLHG
jgi:hypothetical protein